MKTKLEEKHFEELGFKKNLVLGTGWLTISSCRDAEYYYTKGSLSVNCGTYWRWYLNNEQRNDLAKYYKEDLVEWLVNNN